MIDLLEEMIAHQKKKLMSIAERVVPNITADDLLQPNDFLALENMPHFRYEEGVLQGIEAAKSAYFFFLKSCAGESAPKE